jgi:hypothetical protein
MKLYIGAFALLLGLSSVSASAGVQAQFKIWAQNGSGEQGWATILEGAPGTNTIIVRVRASGAPVDVAQPMHIHRGNCNKLDPKPAYALHALVNGTSETVVNGITLADLEKGDYAINIHKGPRDVSTYVACGNLKKEWQALH